MCACAWLKTSSTNHRSIYNNNKNTFILKTTRRCSNWKFFRKIEPMWSLSLSHTILLMAWNWLGFNLKHEFSLTELGNLWIIRNKMKWRQLLISSILIYSKIKKAYKWLLQLNLCETRNSTNAWIYIKILLNWQSLGKDFVNGIMFEKKLLRKRKAGHKETMRGEWKEKKRNKNRAL